MFNPANLHLRKTTLTERGILQIYGYGCSEIRYSYESGTKGVGIAEGTCDEETIPQILRHFGIIDAVYQLRENGLIWFKQIG